MNHDHRHPSPLILAWARLLRTHKQLLEQIQLALSQAQLPPLEWYDLLLELHLAEGARLRLFDLGERMLLSRSNLTRLCDRLEKEGLISRAPCEHDKRGQYATLTEQGAALRLRMWPVYRQAIEHHFAADLSAAEVQQLADLLLKARGADAAAQPQP